MFHVALLQIWPAAASFAITAVREARNRSDEHPHQLLDLTVPLLAMESLSCPGRRSKEDDARLTTCRVRYSNNLSLVLLTGFNPPHYAQLNPRYGFRVRLRFYLHV